MWMKKFLKFQKKYVFPITDCYEGISSIPDRFMQNHTEKKKNKNEPTAFTTIKANSSKASNREKVSLLLINLHSGSLAHF